MRPMNLGQRREQALMRGFAGGYNMSSNDIFMNKIIEQKLFEACMNAYGLYLLTEEQILLM